MFAYAYDVWCYEIDFRCILKWRVLIIVNTYVPPPLHPPVRLQWRSLSSTAALSIHNPGLLSWEGECFLIFVIFATRMLAWHLALNWNEKFACCFGWDSGFIITAAASIADTLTALCRSTATWLSMCYFSTTEIILVCVVFEAISVNKCECKIVTRPTWMRWDEGSVYLCSSLHCTWHPNKDWLDVGSREWTVLPDFVRWCCETLNRTHQAVYLELCHSTIAYLLVYNDMKVLKFEDMQFFNAMCVMFVKTSKRA